MSKRKTPENDEVMLSIRPETMEQILKIKESNPVRFRSRRHVAELSIDMLAKKLHIK